MNSFYFKFFKIFICFASNFIHLFLEFKKKNLIFENKKLKCWKTICQELKLNSISFLPNSFWKSSKYITFHLEKKTHLPKDL